MDLVDLPEDPFGQSAERVARGTGEEASAWVEQPPVFDTLAVQEVRAAVASMRPALQAVECAIRDSGLDAALGEHAALLLSQAATALHNQLC